MSNLPYFSELAIAIRAALYGWADARVRAMWLRNHGATGRTHA